ncbi:hypothetical protein [Rhizohabitans arisaemae]|uniref:hypothetical protein n=1 Tax=Rhizohabitans arisaemae TaxID=2720610 RepID=UPI0024B1A6DF|nr:hypothetical protein [Rhizohabitans arisaemae]
MRPRLPSLIAAISLLTFGIAAPTPSSAGTGASGGVVVRGDPLTGSGAVGRTALTAEELQEGDSSGPVPDQAFAVPAEAAKPTHTFEGRLSLLGESSGGGFAERRDWDNRAGEADSPIKHLPEISVEFVQSGSHLIPRVQGLAYTGDPNWNLIVGPGRAWRENGDDGWSRAAFPFSIVVRNHNCTHNGSMTFLYTSSEVSRVRYQITQETCLRLQFDMWGQLEADYRPSRVPGAHGLKAAHAAEVASRLPSKPFAQLAVDHPGVDPSAFTATLTPEHLTAYGVLYRGVHYAGDCRTRYGTYAFCENMRLPSYSTAKTAFAAIAQMRLAQKYGMGAAGQLLKDHVPELAHAAGDWSDVTLEHAVDQATGNFDSAAFMGDEDTTMNDFLNVESYQGKVNAALRYPRRAAPGTQWVYHTSDTFLATRAMNNYLRKRAGGSSDVFRMVADEVYKPIKLSAGTRAQTLRTDNSPNGSPVGGYGLFWNADDLAKVAKLMNDDAGRAGGAQLLHPGLLAQAMQRDPANRGLPMASIPLLYNNGTLASTFTPEAFPLYRCTFRVPFMSGYGGITVAMMPNGVTFYYVGDNNEWYWDPAVHAAHVIAPHCP